MKNKNFLGSNRMFNKQRWKFIVSLCIILFFVCLSGAYLYYNRTINVSVDDCEPTEGILLAYVDGQPYYYDSLYLYKLTDGAFPEEPSIIDKKKALFYELAYLESISDGNTVSEKMLKDEIEIRKYNVQNWSDTLAKAEASLEENMNSDTYSAESISNEKEEVAELKEYVQQYCELWTECTEGEGITDTEYWQTNLPYLKKGILVASYYSTQMDDYLQKIENQEEMSNVDCFSDSFYLQNFDELVEKYQVEIIDSDLK